MKEGLLVLSVLDSHLAIRPFKPFHDRRRTSGLCKGVVGQRMFDFVATFEFAKFVIKSLRFQIAYNFWLPASESFCHLCNRPSLIQDQPCLELISACWFPPSRS